MQYTCEKAYCMHTRFIDFANKEHNLYETRRRRLTCEGHMHHVQGSSGTEDVAAQFLISLFLGSKSLLIRSYY